MPYTDKEYDAYHRRTKLREKRHPAWRQVFLDCSGICVFRDQDGVLCGQINALEFHELWREAKNGENKFQQRALVCNFHHFVEHEKDGFMGKVNPRPHKSQLQNDVNREMQECGGMAGWIEKYGLIDKNGEGIPAVGGFDTSEYETNYYKEFTEGRKWQ